MLHLSLGHREEKEHLTNLDGDQVSSDNIVLEI